MRRLALPALRVVTGSLVGLVVGALLAWIILPPGIVDPLTHFLWIPPSGLIDRFSSRIPVVEWSTGIALLASIANELGNSESWSRFIDEFRRPLRNLLIAIMVVCGSTFIWVGGTTTPQGTDYPYRVFPLAAILVFAVMAVLLTTKYRPSSSFSSERLGDLVLLGLVCGGAFLAGVIFAYITDVLAAATSSGITVQSNTGTGLVLLVLFFVAVGLVTIAVFGGVVLSLFLALILATAQLIPRLLFLPRRSAA
jgi:hypothetical protein